MSFLFSYFLFVLIIFVLQPVLSTVTTSNILARNHQFGNFCLFLFSQGKEEGLFCSAVSYRFFFFFFNIYFLVMLHLILGDIMGKAGKNIFKFLSFFLSGN